jgi:phosphatidate cytidylyltransferase
MLRRSLTGLVLGIVMISGLLYSNWTAAILFLIILIYTSMEWYQHFTVKEGRIASTIFISTILLCSLLILINLINNDLIWKDFDILNVNRLLIMILAILGFAIISKKNWPVSRSWYAGIFYIALPILVAYIFLNANFIQHKWIILGLIIINWSNDVFAYITGSLIGKHKLAPDISPKKTIEGAAGGLFAAIAAAWLVNEYLFIESYSLILVIILGFAVWLAGTAGDLYESGLKRIIGIKDSGNLLPGHGGFLDRFDSFFFIIPVGIFVLTF